jgi:hypothetical protein
MSERYNAREEKRHRLERTGYYYLFRIQRVLMIILLRHCVIKARVL